MVQNLLDNMGSVHSGILCFRATCMLSMCSIVSVMLLWVLFEVLGG